jgi:hypothetical protein
VSKQTGDSIKTLETNYAKYLPEVDTGHDVIEAAIKAGADKVRSGISAKISEIFSSEQQIKKPSKNQGLFHGAGEEGRTPDLMLGKHTL